jgi:UDP-MurNAc hydroxylase
VKVRYIYSACIVIETADCRICCDPWFTQGVYEGSWYQFPVVADPIAIIGNIDYVYVSHIHPDHYDPIFLKSLLLVNPNCTVIVGAENQKYLISKMRRDGFAPISVSEFTIGRTHIRIFPNFIASELGIDSALAVKENGMSVVNMNDCPFDENQIKQVKEFCGGSPDFACLPYAGAGPYPQMYQFKLGEELLVAVERKKEQFAALFGNYLSTLDPRYAMPFAGLYYLGGSLRSKNEFRGIFDSLEMKKRHGDSIVVLQEELGEFNVKSGAITHARHNMQDVAARDKFLAQFDNTPYPYQIGPLINVQVLVGLLQTAHGKAITRLKNLPQGYICFKVASAQYLCVHAKNPGVVDVRQTVEELKNAEIITIDTRLLHGLLTKKYHWNNAEVGSHFEFYRDNGVYDHRVYDFLNFLHI